jgi:protein OS-9
VEIGGERKEENQRRKISKTDIYAAEFHTHPTSPFDILKWSCEFTSTSAMLPLSVLLACSLAVLARLLHSLPEDTYALPKYRVAFLNSLPLFNLTAQRWLSDGLPGGEREFLDQPWSTESSPKEIGDGVDPVRPPIFLSVLVSPRSCFVQKPSPSSFPYHSLEIIKLTPRDAYLCLIPLPLDQPLTPSDDPPLDVMAVQSWSLLQPLYGTCLYVSTLASFLDGRPIIFLTTLYIYLFKKHRQGWFTYSYCHNEQIRQFRELPHAHPHPSMCQTSFLPLLTT